MNKLRKVITEILDDYFTNKLLEEIKWSFIERYLDYKFESDKYRIIIKVKLKKYKDEFYSAIIKIDKNDSFKYMCDLDNFRKQIDEIIIDYQREKGRYI